MSKTFNQKIAEVVNVAIHQRMVKRDWGFTLVCESEFEALRIAYAYRNSPHGVKIDTNEVTGYWGVTVFNDTAKDAGISTH